MILYIYIHTHTNILSISLCLLYKSMDNLSIYSSISICTYIIIKNAGINNNFIITKRILFLKN